MEIAAMAWAGAYLLARAALREYRRCPEASQHDQALPTLARFSDAAPLPPLSPEFLRSRLNMTNS